MRKMCAVLLKRDFRLTLLTVFKGTFIQPEGMKPAQPSEEHRDLQCEFES